MKTSTKPQPSWQEYTLQQALEVLAEIPAQTDAAPHPAKWLFSNGGFTLWMLKTQPVPIGFGFGVNYAIRFCRLVLI